MDKTPPRVRRPHKGDGSGPERRRRSSRYGADHDFNGGDGDDEDCGRDGGRDDGACGGSMECSGKHCRSCTGRTIADCVALCCCPCGVINILALALIKVPYKVGRRCLGFGKKGEKAKRKCKKIEIEGGGGSGSASSITDGSLITGKGVNEGSLGISLSGFTGERQSDADEAEKFWLELYQVGHLGFGRVSFTGVPPPSQ